MREDLDAALDAAAEQDETVSFEETPQEVVLDAAEEPAEAQASEEEGSTEPRTDATEPTSEVPAPDATAGPEELEGAKSGDSIKAPIDWSPKEREDWSKIPRHLQEKVMSREKDMSNMLNQTADARRTHDQFGQLVNQYGSVLSGVAGNTPMETVGNLFSTVANLRMGSPIQKAQVIADLIKDFGVDINTLDSAIVGEAPPAHIQQNSEVERLLAERLAPFEQMMGQQNAYQQQQHQQKQQAANAEVHNFAQNAEFLADVRMDMADLIDMSSKQGRELTMQQAYDKACTLNPQIQAVLAQRAQQAQLTAGSNTMAGKRAAAASVHGHRGGAGGGNGPASMRDTIAAAWDGAGKI